jgi:acetyltransferase-like isoleucine patch superfamily enzyme
MNSIPTASDLRQKYFDFCPWVFGSESTAEEKAAQAEYQALLRRVYGTTIGRNGYLSPHAAISGQPPHECLVMGDDSYVAHGSYITGSITLGNSCTVNPYVTLRGKVRSGDSVRIGAHACIVGFNHGHARLDIPIHRQPLTCEGIVLGSDIWVGSHVIIIDGVTVGSHTILAAGAVVTKDVPDYAIVGGNPARLLRLRTQDEAARKAVPPEIAAAANGAVHP